MNSRPVLAVIQKACGDDRTANVTEMADLVGAALDSGADIVLPQELFGGPYFCQTEHQDWFKWASSVDEDPGITAIREVTAGRGAVVPVSFFERAGQAHYNSVAVVEDGEVLGIYRKSHIPDGPGYEEKFYFNPGDTGFRAWPTRHGTLGVGICWDQWFPEAARAMALIGADLLLYPTAIGSEIGDQAENDTADMWRRAMDGHAVCNTVPLAAANRVGTEGELTFYGSSFIVDHRGRALAEADRTSTTTLVAELDLAAARADRAGWGLFRDRRPDLYGPLLTNDGQTAPRSIG
jgi:N-carbamoylputrescine amidase